MKIYDCFNFFNELDVLEIRLGILYNHVDHFVIVESDITHSGEKKPFYFEDNKERYSKYLNKIIHYKVYDTPNNFIDLPITEDLELNKIFNFIKNPSNRWFNRSNQPDYGRDFFQKECQRRPLINCDDNDIVMFSDADEIPNPTILDNIHKLDLENVIYTLNQYTYYYYLNVLKQTDWYGTKVGLYKNIKNLSLNDIRGKQELTTKLLNGGWHFSFMGGEEMVKKKITSYSAREMASQEVLSLIKDRINNNIDPFNRGPLNLVEIDETYPKYLLDNKEKYKHMIK